MSLEVANAKMVVYLVINKVNGKVYIGKTVSTLGRRWRGHLHAAVRGAGHLLHRAIRKYGARSFTIKILRRCRSERRLLWTERYYIALFESNNKEQGYNLTDGGEGVSGLKFSAESRRRLCESHLGHHPSGETRAKLSAAIKLGKSKVDCSHSEKTKKKISKALKGRPHGPMSTTTKRRLSAAMKGRKPTAACIEASRAWHHAHPESSSAGGRARARSGYRHSVATKAKISSSHIGIRHSEETKARLSAIFSSRRSTL